MFLYKIHVLYIALFMCLIQTSRVNHLEVIKRYTKHVVWSEIRFVSLKERFYV